MDIRIGQGHNVYASVERRKLILGGMEIPHTRGPLSHSDADVLLHAITDALFSAAGLGDIGRHFPDTDPAFAGVDSHMLLREAVRHVRKAGYAIGSVDVTVTVQKPKLAPHVPGVMTDSVGDLDIALERCNAKAKTNGKLGLEGKEEGIIAQAVVPICYAEGVDQDWPDIVIVPRRAAAPG